MERTEEEKKLFREFMEAAEKNVDWSKFDFTWDDAQIGLAAFESAYAAFHLAVKELVKERRKNLSRTRAR